MDELMMNMKNLILLLTVCLILAACDKSNETPAGAEANPQEPAPPDTEVIVSPSFDWKLPKGINPPVVPQTNPMTEAKFQFGRYLFYDTRLSANDNIACSSCHHQDKAFADGLSVPFGTYGDPHPRNSQALANMGWYASFNWSNQLIVRLEAQVAGPLLAKDPPEHGISPANFDFILEDIAADPKYQELFQTAFPDNQEDWNFTLHIIPALATFVRGMTSFNSPYDHYLRGDDDAISAAAQRGFNLFKSDQLKCAQCHLPNHFLTDSYMDTSYTRRYLNFHNTGSVDEYQVPNTGVHQVSGKAEHFGQFRTPSLRNIALTRPYMHNGSQPDLRSVIQTYAAGGRSQVNKDPLITGFEINAEETSDLIAFLCSLTDETFITNPRYSNPWPDENGNPRPAPANPGVPEQCL